MVCNRSTQKTSGATTFNPCPKPPKSKQKSRVEVWNRIRQNVLKPLFEDREIGYCEITRYEFEQGNITEKQARERNFNLSFAHRHKRDWYKQFGRETEEKLLGDFNQVLLLGHYYHNLIENDAELTRHYFRILRSPDDYHQADHETENE